MVDREKEAKIISRDFVTQTFRPARTSSSSLNTFKGVPIS